MLYYRRKILLSLLQLFGGSLDKISLQKLLFIFTRGQEQGLRTFDFLPYMYGCYSFQVNQDINTLEKYGYLKIDDDKVNILTSNNIPFSINIFDNKLMRDIFEKFKDIEKDKLKYNLIKYTYVKYPYYAINSKIIDTIDLTNEQKNNIKEKKKHYFDTCIFSMGYEGISLESYLNNLIIRDIRVLCDVRKNAYSQKYGFSKSTLEKACTNVGIKYIHIPDLGIESKQRQSLTTQQDYDILFDFYEKNTLPNNLSAINYLRSIIADNKRIVLTCFEKNPKQCHRTRILKYLMSIKNTGYKAQEIIIK